MKRLETTGFVGHEERVRRIAGEIRARSGDGAFVSLGKEAVSHMVPNPRDPRHADRKLDVRDLRDILAIDIANRTCTAEPGVTFVDLVRATLPLGLAPALVPELRTITVGGAVAGCSVESMSFRHGGFHDSCVEYEVVTGRGEVLRCSRQENADVFEMVHGSYGTLGVITRLKFRLVPAKRFVRVDYRTFTTFEAFRAALLARVQAQDCDFIDAIAHARDRFVLCLGHFVDAAPYTSDYTFLDRYYASTRERTEDYLETEPYFFRYDADCHWLTRTVPGLSSKLGRLLLGKLLLGSTNLLAWSERLRPILKHQRRRPVVVDLFIPRSRFEEFFRWYEEEVDFYPLWIVPYRVPRAYPWIAPAHAARMHDDLFIDCAIYGKRNDTPGLDWSEVLERKTFELNGIKTLISDNFYDRETFWAIYDKERYDRVKAKTDPRNLFRNLYDKFNFGRAKEAAPARRIAEAA
jgi:FAD/FMN-containing dehydrogenase